MFTLKVWPREHSRLTNRQIKEKFKTYLRIQIKGVLLSIEIELGLHQIPKPVRIKPYHHHQKNGRHSYKQLCKNQTSIWKVSAWIDLQRIEKIKVSVELRLHEKAKKGNSLCQQTIFLIIEPITERRVERRNYGDRAERHGSRGVNVERGVGRGNPPTQESERAVQRRRENRALGPDRSEECGVSESRAPRWVT